MKIKPKAGGRGGNVLRLTRGSVTKVGCSRNHSRRGTLARRSNGKREEWVYFEFELDPEQFRLIECLAREAGCAPFDYCVRLLKEALPKA